MLNNISGMKCAYVYMCVCTYNVCIDYMCTYVHIHMHIHAHKYIFECVHNDLFVCVCVHVQTCGRAMGIRLKCYLNIKCNQQGNLGIRHVTKYSNRTIKYFKIISL